MIISDFSVQPDPTACGTLTSLHIEVQWAGIGGRRVRVCVSMSNPCTFTSQAPARDEQAGSCLTETGVSPLTFLIQGRFNCPPGTSHPMLTATAVDVNNGDHDVKSQPITVLC